MRVLNFGGHYQFNVWGSWQNNPFAQIIHEMVAEFFPDNPPGFYKVPFGYHDIDIIRDSILASGFDQVNIEPVNIVSNIPSAEVFANSQVLPSAELTVM